MPKFFPGCPVKKNRGSIALGITARVKQFPYQHPKGGEHLKFDMLVVLEQATMLLPAGTESGVVSDQWDPIIPDGMKPVKDSELLCLPDGSFNPDGVLTPCKEEVYV